MNVIYILRLSQLRAYSSRSYTSSVYKNIQQHILKTPVLLIQPVRQCTQVFKHRIIRPSEDLLSVTKDTVLYRYENSTFMKIMNVFGFSQFFFWTYLSHFAFSEIKPVVISEEMKSNTDLPWWRKIDFGQYRYGMTAGCFMLGWGTLAIAWMYTLRSVRYLQLLKGGEKVRFVTYTPFGKNRWLTVPLEQVSAKQSRMSCKVQLPLKIQGKAMHYLLDMRGEFPNVQLFDHSAGLRRNWHKA